MAGKTREVSSPLLDNIRAQPQALRRVAEYQLGHGRDALLRSAGLLRSAKRVVFSGMGASLFACIPLACELGAEVIDSSELLYFRQSFLQPGTAVVLVSRSGESVEVTKLLPILKQRKCVVIGVTNAPGSPLASQADQAIILNSPADQLVAIQTYTATVLALLLLGDPEVRDLWSTLDLFERQLHAWTEAEYKDFLDSNAPVYLLGRGPAMGSVHEGALLFHETAKASAVGMSAAQFRHGPVEVVDVAFRAIVFGTAAETATLDSALAADLRRMGAKVFWLGPDVAPPRFAPLFEIVPCQLLAFRLAEIRGIRAGEFRWAPAITRSETGFTFAKSQ
ncbi:MAG TPA: SIS domain-containing protein [Bryobacteraceae bacterium]|nr:SIS domain-containing protein [Bryobacteraceae bacterium]